MAESGLPGYEVNGWYGLLAPARTPEKIINRLGVEVRKAVQSPEMKDRLSSLGVDAAGSTPAEFQRVIEGDIAKWQKLIKGLHITVE